MQSKVVYRYVAEPKKLGGYYISVFREETLDKAIPVKPGKMALKGLHALADSSEHAKTNSQPDITQQAGLLQKGLQEHLGEGTSDQADISDKDKANRVKLAASPKLAEGASSVTAEEQVPVPGKARPKNVDSTLQQIGKNIYHAKEVSKAKMERVLAGSMPIELNLSIHPDDRKAGAASHLLGELLIVAAPAHSAADATISEQTQDGVFQIRYERPALSTLRSDSKLMQPDDAAMIARAFMLGKLATARMEVRDTLKEQTDGLQSMQAEPDQPPPPLLPLWRKLEAQEHDEAEHGTHHDVPDAGTLLHMEDRLAAKADALHWFAHRYKGALYSLTGILLVFGLGWVWQPYFYGYAPLWSLLGWLLVVLSIAGGAVFLLYALNLKSLKHRIEEKLHENSTEKLSHTMADLVQTNTNVAALNLTPAPLEAPVSELLLCKMDQALHLKERLTSIESVIKARATYLNSNVQHIEKHRDRVRRSITAAGSGVFVGFFTYEVGESVMSYLHVAHHQDANAMLYWLFANKDRIKVAEEHATPAHQETIAAPHTVHHAPEIDAAFLDAYHQPELYAHSWLLTLTIVFSVITAWIAIRKPESEQGGGHGHH